MNQEESALVEKLESNCFLTSQERELLSQRLKALQMRLQQAENNLEQLSTQPNNMDEIQAIRSAIHPEGNQTVETNDRLFLEQETLAQYHANNLAQQREPQQVMQDPSSDAALQALEQRTHEIERLLQQQVTYAAPEQTSDRWENEFQALDAQLESNNQPAQVTTFTNDDTQSTLQTALNEKLAEIDRLNAQLDTQNRNLESAQRSINEQARELYSLNNQLRLTQSGQNTTPAIDVSHYEQQLAAQHEAIAEKDALLERRAHQMSIAEEQIAQIVNQLLQFKNQAEVNAAKVTELETALTEKTGELEQARTQIHTEPAPDTHAISALQDQISSKNNFIGELTQQLFLKDQRINELTTTIQSHETEISNLLQQQSNNVAHADLEFALNERTALVTQLQQQLAEREYQLHTLNADLQQKDVNFGALYSELQQKNETISALQTELQQQKDNTYSAHADWQQNNENINTLQAELYQKNETINQLQTELQQKDIQLTERDMALQHAQNQPVNSTFNIPPEQQALLQSTARLDALLQEKDQQLMQQFSALAEKDRLLAEKEQHIQVQSKQLLEKTYQLDERDKLLHLKDQHMLEQSCQIGERDSLILAREQDLQQRESQLMERERLYLNRETTLSQQLENLSSYGVPTSNTRMSTFDRVGLQTLENKVQQQDKVIHLKDTIINQLNQQLAHRDKVLQGKDMMLQKLTERLKNLNSAAN